VVNTYLFADGKEYGKVGSNFICVQDGFFISRRDYIYLSARWVLYFSQGVSSKDRADRYQWLVMRLILKASKNQKAS